MAGLTITLKRPTPRASLGYFAGQVLDSQAEPGWERQPGAVVHILFPGIPLELWTPVAQMAAIEALNAGLRPSGTVYRVTDWHTGGTRTSPTGRDLHLVYATLLCLEITGRAAVAPAPQPLPGGAPEL